MVDFADRVRIKATEDTERLGLAGREGRVYGWTTPSSTGVVVIGEMRDDSAINVHFDDSNSNFWFSAELVETIDHGAGTVVSLDGQDIEWVRLTDGTWEQRPRPK